jgi:hypothetical protein
MKRPAARHVLGAMFLSAGIAYFARVDFYDSRVPDSL